MKKLLILLCFIPLIGSSQIVYTNYNQTVALSNTNISTSYSSTYNMDIDNNGQRDFAFTIQKDAMTNTFKSISIATDATYSNKVYTKILNTPLSGYPMSDKIVDIEGQNICSSYILPSPYTGIALGTEGWFGGSTFRWETTDLYNGDNSIYIGVSFSRVHPINGIVNIHYGYIHIGLGSNNALVLFSSAWNPVPNSCIVADDYYLLNSGIVCTQSVNVPIYDTIVNNVYDTLISNVYDTLTIYYSVPVYVNIYDTVLVPIYANIPIYDTVPFSVPAYVYDTIPFNIPVYDTVNVGINIYDTITTYTVHTDTNFVTDTNIVNLGTYSDTLTTYNTVTDTNLITLYATLYDTVGCNTPNPPIVPDPAPSPDPVMSNVYPNPVINILTISNYDINTQYYIINTLGTQTLLNTSTIDMSSYTPGLYIICYMNAEGLWVTHKVFKS